MEKGGWTASLNINLVSPYAAAQEAVKAWRELDEKDVQKTFIYTGNCSTHVAVPMAASLRVGTRVGAMMIENASKAYEGDVFSVSHKFST